MGGSSTVRLTPRTRAQGPESVLIIGGGATGLVTLRNLSEERAYDDAGSYAIFDAMLVERRDDVGGVWYWSDETYALERAVGADKVQGLSPLFDPRGQPHWPSPAYLNLRGNVLPEFLEFSGQKFQPPANGETFPSLAETHQYLRSFAEPYRSRIRCGVEVLRVEELAQDAGWKVTLKHWTSSLTPPDAVSFTPTVEERTFDRIVVAAGWYDTPYYPDAPGLQEARKAGHIHHCKHYRDSIAYRGKKVVVVGNNNSANEVAAHLAPLNSVDHPVYRSAKTAPVDKCPSLPDERIKDVGMITTYKLTRAVGSERGTQLELTLVDGSVIGGVDYVVLGTGYGQKYPWLHVLTDQARARGTGEVELLTPDSLRAVRVPRMYNHALYAPSPRLTLAFVGLVISTMPFSFNDLISAWITAVWAGKIPIPSTLHDRLQDERTRLDWMYARVAARNPNADRNDPTTYVGYHLLGGSLKDGPPSELHFAAELHGQLEKADPKRTRMWSWRWDQQREDRQTQMYVRKRQWLEHNAQRIRNDPFDLLGANNKYTDLVPLLVHPDWRPKSARL